MLLLTLSMLSVTSVAQAATGSIDVKVSNAPGEIMLDGFPTGKMAPALLESVPVGTHQVELEYGCMIGKADAVVKADETLALSMPLENKGGTGTLRLRGLSYSAEVMIDGAPVAKADEGVPVACGARRVVVEAPGFAPWTELVVVTTGKWATLEVALEETMGEGGRTGQPRPSEARPVRGGLDDLDELDELDGPDDFGGRGDTYELDELDEPDDLGRSRDRGSRSDRVDGLDELDELDELDDGEPSVRSRGGGLDEPAGDELDDEYFDEGRTKRPEKPKKESNVPWRGLGTAAGVVVLAGGAVVAIPATGDYAVAKQNRDSFLSFGQNEEAAEYTVQMDEAQPGMIGGYALMGAGVALGAVSFFTIPAKDKSNDLVVTPTLNGLSLSGQF